MLNVEYASALSILDCLFRFPSRLFTNITNNNASSISARFKSYFREIGPLPMTGSDVTKVCSAHVRIFRTFTIVIVQNVLLRMTDMATGCDVIEGHVTG